MRILFCSEFYAPSIGGVQEVIRQIAERLAAKGHDVTVATSKLPNRTFSELNGVHIKEFDIAGNFVQGMRGELENYHHEVINGGYDVLMVKAAQQWTFDALWPILEQIEFPKVFIPCGFSGLYEPRYSKYFELMPKILQQFDHLIFYASDYRDINFAKKHGLGNFSILPNGASEHEFNVVEDAGFRSRHNIPEDAFLFMTVGSLIGLKGHQEVAEAFQSMTLPVGKKAVLILNGNECARPGFSISELPAKTLALLRAYGILYCMKHALKSLFNTLGLRVEKKNSFRKIADEINSKNNGKTVLLTNFPRTELVQAFLATDLFVFASNVEYSPLVLFESAAAGTPFLTVDVGNAKEIAEWTECGEICPSTKDQKGYTYVDPLILADKMANLMLSPTRLAELGDKGRKNWLKKFTWQIIAARYEHIFKQLRN